MPTVLLKEDTDMRYGPNIPGGATPAAGAFSRNLSPAGSGASKNIRCTTLGYFIRAQAAPTHRSGYFAFKAGAKFRQMARYAARAFL
jgi:hypothetical protein